MSEEEMWDAIGDRPSPFYLDSPNHNPPGILATGQLLQCEDGERRCGCVCHCAYCLSELRPDRAKHRQYDY